MYDKTTGERINSRCHASYFTTKVPAASITNWCNSNGLSTKPLGRAPRHLPAGGTLDYISQRAQDLRAGALGKLRRPSPSLKLSGHSRPPPRCRVSSLSRSPSSRGSASVCVCLAGLMASTLRFDGQVVLVTGAGGGEHAKAGGHALPGGRGVGAAAVGSQSEGGGRRCGVGEEAAWGARGWTRWDRV